MTFGTLTQNFDLSEDPFSVYNTIKSGLDLLDGHIFIGLEVFRRVDYAIGSTANHLRHFVPVIYLDRVPIDHKVFLTLDRRVQHLCLITMTIQCRIVILKVVRLLRLLCWHAILICLLLLLSLINFNIVIVICCAIILLICDILISL